MKFRANLANPQALDKILQALSKLGSSCVLNLSPQALNFFMSKEFTSGEECFVEIDTVLFISAVV